MLIKNAASQLAQLYQCLGALAMRRFAGARPSSGAALEPVKKLKVRAGRMPYGKAHARAHPRNGL
jgi:hypothetical protein